MFLLIIITILLISFSFIFFIKKRSFFNSILFTLIILLLLLFIFDKKFTIPFYFPENEKIYTLIDLSYSCQNEILEYFKNQKISKNFPIYYFSDIYSQNTNQLNYEFTALYDNLDILKRIIKENSKIIIISDFNDNYSILSFKKHDNIIPIVVNKNTNDTLSIYNIDIPEYIEENNLDCKISILSRIEQNSKLIIFNNDKEIYNKNLKLKTGYTNIQINLHIANKGYNLIKFNLFSQNDKFTNNNSHEKLIKLVDSFYKILVIAGRPSVEFSFLKRFLKKINWIKFDYNVLFKKTDKYEFKNLKNYDGILLMDITDSQLQNLNLLINEVNNNKPILYYTGIHSYDSIKNLLQIFTNIHFIDKPIEKIFQYNNEEIILKVPFDVNDFILNTKNKTRIIIGFNSWKWDFIRLYEGIKYYTFENFWQNQINFLITGLEKKDINIKLNYILGENNSFINTNKYGVYNINNEIKINLEKNLKEYGDIIPNIEIAKKYNTNIYFLNDITNINEFINNIQNNKKLFVKKSIEINFRNNKIIFFVLIGLLILFWILWDIEEIYY